MKSYIVQYATNAWPYLRVHRPHDQRLRDTLRACNDWMARVQTAAGGWSYPGPTTAGFQWNSESCHGLMLGCEVAPKPVYPDAIQRELRALTALFQVPQPRRTVVLAQDLVVTAGLAARIVRRTFSFGMNCYTLALLLLHPLSAATQEPFSAQVQTSIVTPVVLLHTAI